MIEFEMTGRVGRDLRLDDVRVVAAREMNLRGNAVINVIDPTKSFQPTFPNADATCVIARRSIDARNDVIYRYKIEGYNHRYESYVPYEVAEYKDVSEAEPVIIVGAGPAGLFAALKLLTLGLKPVILERGKNVRDRKFDMAALVREGTLDPDSNYCYGEGGAGAFSDGKLYTRSSKRGDIKEVLQQFVNFGANPQILIDAHPHIGTDRLPKIVENIRTTIESKGGEYHFGTKVTGLTSKKDGTIEVKALDSEHPTKTTGKPKAVKYVAKKVQVDERGVFSFCMCPGGVLVPSATEPETIVMNGMSNSARSGKFANAGVVVQIEPDDIPEEYSESGPFKGLDFQKAVERKMWEYAHTRSDNPMAAPAQRMIDFCNGVVSSDLPETSYKPGVVPAPLHELLPELISSRLQKAFPEVNKHSIRGFFTNEALLIGVESRTSSPIRIGRNPRTYESDSFPGLLPCGEGAGYSGGIVSSAIDGINCAVAAARSLSEPEVISDLTGDPQPSE